MNLKTKKPNKQRKKIYSAKIHQKRKYIIAPLSNELSKKINKKKIALRKGDTVKIQRGDFKGKSGKVEKIDYNNKKIFIKSITKSNKNGQERFVPLVASNLLVLDVVLEDQKRIKTPVKK